MVRLTTREKVVIGLGLIVLGLLYIGIIVALEIGLWGCMAYLLMNKLLPLFDISCPLTWAQCFGVGELAILIRTVLLSILSIIIRK